MLGLFVVLLAWWLVCTYLWIHVYFGSGCYDVCVWYIVLGLIHGGWPWEVVHSFIGVNWIIIRLWDLVLGFWCQYGVLWLHRLKLFVVVGFSNFVCWTWVRWDIWWLQGRFVACIHEWALGGCDIVWMSWWCCMCGCLLECILWGYWVLHSIWHFQRCPTVVGIWIFYNLDYSG